ncbi:MAG: DUF1460 domain-containing protein [Muribaculaceae bacterium]|nr:DUF1460 domain-containing protein [Muribaculaceae bacterium]
MKQTFLHLLLYIIPFFSIHGITLDEINFYNKASDTAKITEILKETYAQNLNTPNQRISFIAKKFLGLPYVAHTLEGNIEMLTVNIDQLDCTTFVETVIAMAYTVGEGRTSWRDYVHNLEQIRYRGGDLDGYSSRLHYISDWITDNQYRGNITEVSAEFPDASHKIKTIDFMTSHRKSYKALSDSIEFQKIKNIEIGYHNHRFPYIKTASLRNKLVRKYLQEGDIIALCTNIDGLDVSHMGLITMVNGVPHLMHASMKAMKVIIDPLPIHKYLQNSKSLIGIRVIRLKH